MRHTSLTLLFLGVFTLSATMTRADPVAGVSVLGFVEANSFLGQTCGTPGTFVASPASCSIEFVAPDGSHPGPTTASASANLATGNLSGASSVGNLPGLVNGEAESMAQLADTLFFAGPTSGATGRASMIATGGQFGTFCPGISC